MTKDIFHQEIVCLCHYYEVTKQRPVSFQCDCHHISFNFLLLTYAAECLESVSLCHIISLLVVLFLASHL